MCGVAGYFGEGNEEILREMTETIRHRGPDDEGFFISDNVGLGFRRLSIIDLSTGHQPIFNEDKSIAIIFNGEIYNYLDLKKDLELRHKFYTATDTEVIVHLYEEYGERVFEKLNGMFAIAIWDDREKKLVLARDRLGKKPLYWARSGDTLVFGSELKALLAHSSVRREIDRLSLQKYLFYEYVPTPHSIFKDVYKLESGHYLVFDGRDIRNETFWDQRFDLYPTMSENEYIEELDARISEAVKIRLISDVPLGVFLSGGIDSSTITYYAQKNSAQKIKTFSIGFDDSSFDESAYAKLAADFLGTEHHHAKFGTAEFLDVLPKIAVGMDEPLADGSLLPTFLLSKWTREHVTVALGGDGGDELFAGYPTFQAHKLAGIYNGLPRFACRIFERGVSLLPTSYNNISFDFKLKKFLVDTESEICHRNQIWLGAFSPEMQRELLSVRSGGSIWEDLENYLKNVKDELRENQLLYIYQKQYMRDDILVKVDRASMMNSLEVRAPLLDYTLVDFIDSIPYNMKIKGWITKYIFKKLMRDKLPKEIVYRSKKGFGIPIGKWLCSELKDLALDYLSETHIKQEGLFNYQFVKKLLDDHFSGRCDNRKYLWTLLCFEMWREKWLNG
jgi:asparagine synthase (glutamine-hydrolysing)